MFTINGLQYYSLPGISHSYSTPNTSAANNSLQIYNMTNSPREFIKQTHLDTHLKYGLQQANDGQNMAYSAYINRAKRAVVDHQYSEANCSKASEELSRLVDIAVFHPNSWFQYKSRIDSLQGITKSADCQQIKDHHRIRDK